MEDDMRKGGEGGFDCLLFALGFKSHLLLTRQIRKETTVLVWLCVYLLRLDNDSFGWVMKRNDGQGKALNGNEKRQREGMEA
ncbi:unnamed protein product [Enterobius vermicularis]|uniref:Ovule protein n=1 Tax=Enterobius vermicularis TaxID=51028 RepID=A0A0N4VK12_ENTVE|nr:unnamed protein product [Enterobius vermicularis]